MNLNDNELTLEIQKAVEPMIISASGWRKVFAPDGEESRAEGISMADAIQAGAAAMATAAVLKPVKTVLVGTDTRPTGKALAGAVIRVLKALGVKSRYLGISAAPEIMAESREAEYSYFFYISASHNPIGHNGFKFGSNGGVFTKAQVQPVIDEFRGIVQSGKKLRELSDILEAGSLQVPETEGKENALEDYHDFVLLTAAGSTEKIGALKKELSGNGPLGVAVDFNGSARCLSVDLRLFDELGIRHAQINGTPDAVVHAIVPEAENLNWCRELLEQKHREDPEFVLGYMPDNDGDRGNLVYIDDDGKARILEAQTVFALIVLSELTTAGNRERLAVAANGSTSLRIEEIAERFGAVCARSEVGEANAVELAELLRSRGYNVPLCGEGSNGGCIIYPSKVRDPLNSVLSLLKLLCYEKAHGNADCTIGKLIASLPEYTTTNAFSPLAGLKVRTNDFSAFKDLYEKLWTENFPALEDLGIYGAQEYQLEGTCNRQQAGPQGRSGNCRGGLKYHLFDRNRQLLGYVWLRPSGTEPLLRILVDIKGDNRELHDKLLAHQRMLIEKTDSLLQSQGCDGRS